MACFATARREGLIEHNPCDGAVLPHRPRVEEDDDGVRPFPRVKLRNEDGDEEEVETMELVVSLVRPDHRLLFEVLAATGVRRSNYSPCSGAICTWTARSPTSPSADECAANSAMGS